MLHARGEAEELVAAEGGLAFNLVPGVPVYPCGVIAFVDVDGFAVISERLVGYLVGFEIFAQSVIRQ